MKYDPQRVAALASRFSAARLPDTDGEAAAIETIAQELASAGWTVSRNPRVGRPRVVRPVLGLWAVVIFLGAGFAALATKRQPILSTCLVLLVVALLVVMVRRRGIAFYRSPTRDVAGVAAFWPEKPQGPCVVILTRVATPATLIDPRRWVLIGLVVLLLGVTQVIARTGAEQWLTVVAWIALAIALTALVIDPWPDRGAVGPEDNRTGLALFIELARTWPKSSLKRMNVCFLAAGGMRSMTIEPPEGLGVHTLMIEVKNPDIGRQLEIGGTLLERELACQAARDLWVPHVESFASVDQRGRIAPKLVIFGVREPLTTDDTAASARAAQIVIEVALRWGKRQATS